MNAGDEVAAAADIPGCWDVLREFVDAADWYRRCLEDVNDRRPVRGLGEAKAGYDAALEKARAVLGVAE